MVKKMRERGARAISHIASSSKSASPSCFSPTIHPSFLSLIMILSAVNICYDSTHQPFASEGAVKIQNLNSERPASKIIRAVLRDSDIDPEDAVNYSIHRCHCRFKIKIEDDEEDEIFDSESTLDELEIKDRDSVFIRKIDEREEEKVDDQGEYSSLSDVKCR